MKNTKKEKKKVKKKLCSHCKKIYESTSTSNITKEPNIFNCFKEFNNYIKNLNFEEFCSSELGFSDFFRKDKKYTKLLADACIDSYYEILNSQSENNIDKRQIIETVLKTGIVEELAETANDSLLKWITQNDHYTFIIQYIDWDKLFENTEKKMSILIAKFLNKVIDYVKE